MFLGKDPQFSKLAKQSKGQAIVAYGQLIVVHAPVILTGLGGGYKHDPPRFVIKVTRFEALPAADEQPVPFVKIEVHGVLQTHGTNPSLEDILAGKATTGAHIESDPFGIGLFLGKDDKWLQRAKELNGKLAVARGELIEVGRDPPASNTVARPSSQIVPLPFYLLDVSDLQPVPAAPAKPQKK